MKSNPQGKAREATRTTRTGFHPAPLSPPSPGKFHHDGKVRIFKSPTWEDGKSFFFNFFFTLWLLRDYLDCVIKGFHPQSNKSPMWDAGCNPLARGTHTALGNPALKRAKRGLGGKSEDFCGLGDFRPERKPQEARTPSGSPHTHCPSTSDSPSPVLGHGFTVSPSYVAGLWG